MITDFTIRRTTSKEIQNHMPYITSSMMEAVNTCPKWGVIHSVQSKVFTVGFRQMALEAGSAMHEVFSCINLYQVGVVQGFFDHADFHGRLLFPQDRYKAIFEKSDPEKTDMQNLESIALRCLATGEFYDDDMDRNRTLSNLEHCSLELVNYWLMNMRDYNIYIADEEDPSAPIGIEQSFDVVFEITDENGEVTLHRFIGLGDAVYQNHDTGKITLGEYKTTSSMNDAWRDAFRTRHQLTGYSAALHAYFDTSLVTGNTVLLGSAIPVRKTTAPVQHFMIERDYENTVNFLNTMLFTNRVINEYNHGAYALHAPMFTHSCNRYFRPCSQIDLCSSAMEDQIAMYEQMLEKPQLSPSEMKALLQNS